MYFLTTNTCMRPLTTEVYSTDRDRFAAVDVFYTIIVVEHLNKSCKCCWNNCFGVINLSVNYSVIGPLLCIAFRAQAWHVRKPHWNALLSTERITTVCGVTAVCTGRIIRHALPRRIGHPLCWVYTVTEQHLLINRGLRVGGISHTSSDSLSSQSSGPLLSLSQCPSNKPHPGDISWFITEEAQAWRCQWTPW